jgi:hypothetical protein
MAVETSRENILHLYVKFITTQGNYLEIFSLRAWQKSILFVLPNKMNQWIHHFSEGMQFIV